MTSSTRQKNRGEPSWQFISQVSLKLIRPVAVTCCRMGVVDADGRSQTERVFPKRSDSVVARTKLDEHLAS